MAAKLSSIVFIAFVWFLAALEATYISWPQAQPATAPQSYELEARRLVAGSVPSSLELRDGSLQISNEAEFYVLYPSPGRYSTPLGGRVSVQAKSPILVLEDMERDLDEINCQGSIISLSFNSLSAFVKVKDAIEQLSEFVTVTAHEGCNENGERTPHWVKNTIFDGVNLVAVLQTSEITWHDAFHTTWLHFGLGEDWSHISSHNHRVLQKRQAQTSETSNYPKQTMSFPTAPSTAPTVTSTTEQINKQIINQQIMPPQIPVIDLFIPQNVIMSCKNCTISGSIEISQGSFAITTSEGLMQNINNTIEFFEHGSVEFIANNFFAHVELDTKLSASLSTIVYKAPLPSIAITPIEIPGVAFLGPAIQPQIIISVTFAESMDFTHGFDVSIPDGSKFVINMTDIGDSTMIGFENPTVKALPFQAGAPVSSLIFSMSFSPQFVLGLGLPGNSISGGVGTFFDLPQLSVNLTQLEGVNGKCEVPSGPGNGIESALDTLFKGNLTNIVPSVNINFGGVADWGVNVPAFSKVKFDSVTITSTSFALPTMCLEFNKEEKTFGPVSVSTTASAADSTTTSKKSAASINGRPLSCLAGSRLSLLALSTSLVFLWTGI